MKVNIIINMPSSVEGADTFEKILCMTIDPDSVESLHDDPMDETRAVMQTKTGRTYLLDITTAAATSAQAKSRRDRKKE